MAEEKPYCYEHPRPALTADAVIFGFDRQEERVKVLLIERKKPPYQGHYAFPGGFVDPDETVSAACHRELKEETGIKVEQLKEFAVFSDPERDPRGRVISVAFMGLVDMSEHHPKAADDAASAQWVKPESLTEELAFDHDLMLRRAMEELNLLLSQKNDKEDQ